MRLIARVFVVAGGLAWLGLVATTLAHGPYGWIWWTCLAGFLLIWVLARVASRDIAEKRAAKLDEYESGLRDQARAVGYWAAILGGLTLFAILTAFAGAARAGDPGPLLSAPALLLELVLAVSALPTFVLAWRLQRD